MSEQRTYERDGAEIYRQSFGIIRAEADLGRFAPAEERVAVRIIHAELRRQRALGADRWRADPM